jgi:hypothetical protein
MPLRRGTFQACSGLLVSRGVDICAWYKTHNLALGQRVGFIWRLMRSWTKRIERSYQDHANELTKLQYDPLLNNLRSDSRLANLLRRVELGLRRDAALI